MKRRSFAGCRALGDRDQCLGTRTRARDHERLDIFGKMGIWCLTLFILLTAPLAARADKMSRTFLDGINAYEAGDFEQAISAFSKIAENGVTNGKLFYNLGNAYLKNDDLGHAILWYERASKLTPDDPDLKFNLEYALSHTKDEKEEKSVSVFQVLFFWKHLFSPKTIQWIAIVLNAAFWVMIILRMIQKKDKIFRSSGYLVLIPALIFTLTAFYNYYETAYVRQAVILPLEVSVRSGLTDDSTELFVLHGGTKVRIEKAHKDSFRIYFSEGKIGWVRKDALGVI